MTNPIDAYIAAAPKAAQPHVRQLRATMRELAPKATERISYGIIGYFYPTRLFFIGAAKSHVAVYPAYDAKGLEKYRYGASTLRFPIDEPLPIAKIKALIKTQVKVRDAAAKATPKRGAARRSASAR